MPDTRKGPGRIAPWLRWTARVIGSLVVAFWLLVGTASLTAGSDPWTWESTVLAVLIVVSALSVMVAWLYEGIGGALVLGCGVVHTIFAYISSGHSKGVAMLLAGGPLVVVGLLFLGSWWASRRRGDGA